MQSEKRKAVESLRDGILFWIRLEELECFQFCIERFVGDEFALDHCCFSGFPLSWE